MAMIRRLSQRSAKVVLTIAIGSGSVAAFQLVSVKDEIAIGQQAQQELRRETPQVGDARVRQYVSDLGIQLAQHASGAHYPYSFSTADYAELNAFALPGGPVWVHRGILSAADNESQVAGVIAHEIAHIAERHAARQITKGTVANGLLGLLGAMLGNDGAGAAAAQMAAGLTANSVMLKFSRDDERAADRVGVDILARAGYDTHGLVEFMRVLGAQQGRSPGSVEQFLSTHPAPVSRVRDLEQLVAANPGGGRRTSAQFADVKRRLAQLPRAHAMPRS
ncbi:TPR repeat-containing protein YfgC precursor [Luteitalea pratensis]|uniref:TPR repeat-containing protein YfgC n=2 Tax=Luteitalea pratensis TaxID=1855912 RepID=A0A143PME9_LUTPR|nr:TPR repeat-containing protein YfgC precursor [Luteitalea pratensis]